MLNFFLNRSKKNGVYERTAIGKLAGSLGLLSNLLLFAGKFIIGLSAQSVSIMADAINSLSDTASSILTLIGFRISLRNQPTVNIHMVMSDLKPSVGLSYL